MSEQNKENAQNFENVMIDENFFAEFPHPTYEEWVKVAEKALKGAPFEKMMVTKTYEGIDLQPIYLMDSMEKLKHVDSLPGFPGYARGTNPLGYVTEPWHIAQESDQILPQELNEVVLSQLERGGSSANIVVDQLTRRGQDFSKEAAPEELDGASISSLQDLSTALSGVDLEKTPVHIFAGEASLGLTGMYVALAKSQGKVLQELKGCIGADPLGVLAKEGKLQSSLEQLFDQMAEVTAWAKDNTPELQTILVQGHPYHDGGGSAIQEVAFALATAIRYINELQNRGLTIDEIAPKIRFSFSVGTNFFMEIAKLRAARVLWSQVVHAFGGNTEAQKMVIHARTSAYTKTVYDPYVNMLRTTTESFSSVIGGIDSLHVSCFDEAIRPSDEFSRRIARNTQIVLQEECNLTQPVDPAGGSWYIENLTAIVGEKSWAILQEIEGQGGIEEALIKSIPQEEIAKVAKERFQNLSKRKDVIVGTNMYPNVLEELLEVPEVDYQQIAATRIRDLEQYRADVDSVECQVAMDKLQENLADFENVIAAFFNGATLGEVTALKARGEGLEIEPVKIGRISEGFEKLRMATENYKKETGKNVQVFLANMGNIPQHKARADFSTAFFEVGAFEILKNEGFQTVEEAAQAALESEAPVVVICSTDKTYPELVPPLAKLIKAGNPAIKLFLAGRPAPEMKDVYAEAGVDDYIHVTADCYGIITAIQKERGVI